MKNQGYQINHVLRPTLTMVTLTLLVAVVFYLAGKPIPNEIVVFGFNIYYLVTAEPEGLQEYFPRFYFFVWIFGLILRIGVPAVIVSFYVWFIICSGRITKFVEWCWPKGRLGEGTVLLPFVATLLVSLAVYYALPQCVSNPELFQIKLSRSFLVLNGVNLVALLLRNKSTVKNYLESFLFRSQNADALAVFRIIFFSITAFGCLGLQYLYGQNIGALAKQPLPGIGWLIEVLPVNPQLYSLACYMGFIVSVFIVVGYRTRLFLVANCFLIFYVVAAPNFFGKLWHNQVFIWITWIMATSPCADKWSLDACLRSSSSDVKESYSFHLRVIWLHLGLIYFFAGFHKLWESGFDWALADTVVNLVTIEWFEHYDKIPFIRIDRFPSFIKAGASLTILFELSYIFLLVGKKSRWLAVAGGLLMHNLIGYFMYIGFELLQVLYVVFVPWEKAINRFGLRKNQKKITLSEVNWSSLRLIIPIFILVANATFGILRIDSYPFSVYPVYTDVVADTVTYFDYRVLDDRRDSLKVREEGRQHNFNWENYSRMEYEIIKARSRTKKLDSIAVKAMWKRWQLEVETLRQVDSVDVFLNTRYLSPDSPRTILRDDYLMTITSKD